MFFLQGSCNLLGQQRHNKQTNIPLFSLPLSYDNVSALKWLVSHLSKSSMKINRLIFKIFSDIVNNDSKTSSKQPANSNQQLLWMKLPSNMIWLIRTNERHTKTPWSGFSVHFWHPQYRHDNLSLLSFLLGFYNIQRLTTIKTPI